MQISRFLTIVSVSTAILFSSSVSAITVWAGANDPSTISDTAAYTWAYSHGITTMSYGAVNMS